MYTMLRIRKEERDLLNALAKVNGFNTMSKYLRRLLVDEQIEFMQSRSMLNADILRIAYADQPELLEATLLVLGLDGDDSDVVE